MQTNLCPTTQTSTLYQLAWPLWIIAIRICAVAVIHCCPVNLHNTSCGWFWFKKIGNSCWLFLCRFFSFDFVCFTSLMAEEIGVSATYRTMAYHTIAAQYSVIK